MKIVLLGGNGFIGSNLTEALVGARHVVKVFDRVQSVPMLPKTIQSQVEYCLGDFSNPTDVKRAIQGCDVVYHLVGPTLRAATTNDPIDDIEQSIAPSIRLFQAAAACGVKKIIFISSGGTVYGTPQKTPIPETHPTEPICAYGINKLAIEKYLALYHHLTGIDYTIVRLSNPFGYYQNPLSNQGVIAAFLHKMLQGESLEIWGDGSVIRDYIWISDVIEALTKILDYQGSAKVFNLGSNQGTSVNDIVFRLQEVTNEKIRWKKFLPHRAIDVPINILDTTLIKGELHWQPVISFQDGIVLFKEWLQNNKPEQV